MKSAAKISLRLAFLIAISLHAQPAPVEDPVKIAAEEDTRRQEATIQMQHKLEAAREAAKRNQWQEAAKLYQDAFLQIGNTERHNDKVDAEKIEVVAGLCAVREKLARMALAMGDTIEANSQADAALKADANNESLHRLKADIRQREAEQLGRVPSPDLIKRGPALEKEKVDIATRVQNAKFLYEAGKLDEAEVILDQIVKEDPSNRSAPYYLNLIKEARYMDHARGRESGVKSAIDNVEAAWIDEKKRAALPVPNPMWNTNLVYTTKGRQQILSKLDAITLNEVTYDLPLKDVLVKLRKESIARDPDGIGINFMINPNVESPPLVDASGAAAPPGVTPQQQDIGSEVTIHITPPLTNLRMVEVLDAIQMVADKPIRYTISDYAVVFSPKPADQLQQLVTKSFRVDPNTFVQGLQNVISIQLNIPTTSSGATGLGGSSGGAGGGAGGATGGAGGNTGQGGGAGTIPSVLIAPVTQGGGQGGGAGGAGALGGGGQGGQGQIGLRYVTRTNSTLEAHQMVRAYFIAAGVDLTPPKNIFFNDRLGVLLVRATTADLDIIQQAIEMLNQTPPQVSIEAKFVDLSQEDAKGLGFNWYLGNTLMNNGAIGVQGGTAPSFQGPSSEANPSGIFPGGGTLIPGTSTYTPGPGATGASSSDGNLTPNTLLRQAYNTTGGTLPTIGTITGIMTDPQFRVAINAIEQRTGSDLLSAPRVTTESGRQAHLAAQDLVNIVTQASVTESTATTGGLVGGAGVSAPSVNYSTSFVPLGPSLDVIPSVSADGFSIQMALLPTYLEFLQYDNPGQFIPQAQGAAGSTLGVPITAQLPLPHFRIRTVATTCDVWDGQTVVLGGLISETISKTHDKVPMLGDLPFFGKLFQSSGSDSTKENLLIFVTPTMIDPAGNPVHTDADLPFARTGVPPQPVPAPAVPMTPAQP